uniref:C2H2-type domain-containing protein n=1 Tax=Mesocestoides corti TaxID=53468 RepID=A0A5K3FMB4_MESCO
MGRVANLPVAERQLLLDKIKRSIDQTEAICSNKLGDNSTLENEPSSLEHSMSKDLHQTTPPVNPPSRISTLPFERKLSSTTAIRRRTPLANRSQLVLACPVCELKATSWQKFSHHLHMGHNQSSVTSVCRRCHGMFRNHALLLAHECFRWGRMNLPCAAIYSSIDDSPILNDFGFPREGVYLERRCGLCLTSDVIYSNFEQYERHKYEEHAETGSKAPNCDIQRPQNKSFQAPVSALLATKPRRNARKPKIDKSVPLEGNAVDNQAAKTPSTTTGIEERVVVSKAGTVAPAAVTASDTPLRSAVQASFARAFSCRVCNLFFRTQERLQRHERTSIVHSRRVSCMTWR